MRFLVAAVGGTVRMVAAASLRMRSFVRTRGWLRGLYTGSRDSLGSRLPNRMKRRRFFQTLAAAPAASALLGQQQPAAPPPRPASDEIKLETGAADLVADPVPHFFNAQQFAALRKLADVLLPPVNGEPGALAAKAPEFLDFLISESPAGRQQVYQAGLDALNAQAATRYGKPFAELDPSQADALLAPLRQPWTYAPPADSLAHFLVVAKSDVRTATVNSREYQTAGASGGGRRMGGTGLYWYPID